MDPRTNVSQDKWVPGQMGPGQMGPRTNGSGTNGSPTNIIGTIYSNLNMFLRDLKVKRQQCSVVVV